MHSSRKANANNNNNTIKGMKMTDMRRGKFEYNSNYKFGGHHTGAKTVDRKARAGSKHLNMRISSQNQATRLETSDGRQHSTVSGMSSVGLHHGLPTHYQGIDKPDVFTGFPSQ